jgi:hypothetical protein
VYLAHHILERHGSLQCNQWRLEETADSESRYQRKDFEAGSGVQKLSAKIKGIYKENLPLTAQKCRPGVS